MRPHPITRFPRFAPALLVVAAITSVLSPLTPAGAAGVGPPLDPVTGVEHGTATNAGVRIHYAALGHGPLVVLIHGFPDFWYTWRDQMTALAPHFRCVALDLRGYNLSDKPKGIESYSMSNLVEDVAAVIHQAGTNRAIVLGHDWGGAVAWTFAMTKPEMTERLVILNLPHPRGIARELATNPTQRKNSSYAREFQREGAQTNLSPRKLAGWVKDPAARALYVEAFERSDLEAMLNYYKRNYPREPYVEDTSPVTRVQCPVLMIHGLDDQALLASGLNGTWDWVARDLTLVTVPKAGHFVQHDAGPFVSRTLLRWLQP